jgi:hypothetical protein
VRVGERWWNTLQLALCNVSARCPASFLAFPIGSGKWDSVLPAALERTERQSEQGNAGDVGTCGCAAVCTFVWWL